MTDIPPEAVEAVARAICPRMKPWMDDPEIIQQGKCECQRVETPHGEGTPLCLVACTNIANAAILAYLNFIDTRI